MIQDISRIIARFMHDAAKFFLPEESEKDEGVSSGTDSQVRPQSHEEKA